MHQGTMEPEDDLSTRDPLDLLSDPGAVPSTSSSLLNCTLLGGLSHSGILERDVGSGDPESPKCLFPTLEPCGNEQRSLPSSSFPSSLTWDSDSEKETLDEEELQHFSNPHGLAAHSPGSPTSGQQRSRLDIDLCQEPEEHLFHAKIVPSALEDDDVTHRNPTTADSQKLTEKIEQDNGGHLPDVIPKDRCQKVKEDSLRKHNQKGLVNASTKEPDVYTFPGDSEPESPPPGPWAHCTFIQRRRKKRAILRPFSGLGNWHRTTGPRRKARVKPSGAKELTKSTDVEGGMLELNRGKEKKVQKKQKSVVSHLGGQEIFTCVECSIYFKKRDHLREHMREHGHGEPGKKWQCGEKESWSGHPTKSVFECVECGLEFADQVPLLDHQRCHEESRQKILEEIGKLNERETRAAEQASCRKASDPITEGSPEVGSGRLVCLKCSFSCDVPQELADHAQTHNTRTRAGVYRTSPRFQQRSCRKGLGQPSGGDASTLVSLFGKRYPIRASKKTKTQPGPSQVPLNPSTQGEPSPDKGTTHTETVRESQEESQTEKPAVAQPVEENVRQHFMSSPQNPPKNAAPRRRDVAFKSIVNKCSARAARGRLGRTRASTRLDPKSNQTQQVQILNKTEENQIPEPDHDPKQSSKTDPVELPAPALQLKSRFTASLRGAAERLGLLQGSQAQLRNKLPLVLIESDSSDHQTPISYNMVMGKKPPANAVDLQVPLSSTQSSNKLDPPEDEPKLNKDQSYSGGKFEEDELVANDLEGDDDDEDDDDVVNRLFGVLTEDDDEDDNGEGLSKSVERKCPYCPDRFHNGIGLANHIRGHLNRVGVSYNVRHFISPEEVNAIEKKFSYQKKKKKVANFDPSTFSVMRCEFCSAGFDTRAGLSSHARAHLRDFGITNWEVTASPINILRELFAKHPNLVLPTPSHTLQSSQDENSDDEHDEKHEENVTTESITESPKQHLKEMHNMKEQEEGGEEVDDDNDEEEDAKKNFKDKPATSPRENSLFSFQEQSPESKETDTIASSLLKCEFCGATFETRRGLSSHARSHLRQLGIGMAENSGAPIDLLRQIAKERATDARFTGTPPSMASPKTPQHHTLTIPSPTKDIETEENNKPTVSFCARPSVKVSSSPAASSAAGSLPSSPFVKSRSPSPVLRKAPISSLLPASSPLRSQEHKTLGKNKATNLSRPNKPFWAPQDTDAPLNLTMDMDSKDIICQLCGAWFETRKGLSSHARAHLRHFGIEYSESKGSPIDLLNRFILTDDFKHKANSFLSDAPGDMRATKIQRGFHFTLHLFR
ncbi:Protein Wiz [Triplophysa tibetana]|uniref:Protein Wiz n=1 Tax=Triplophysa tibetana TaxID=1572043 RepID=A0A5A9NAL3_9TELE|nr:Protein Wiz [Triplophysa tibetana]